MEAPNSVLADITTDTVLSLAGDLSGDGARRPEAGSKAACVMQLVS